MKKEQILELFNKPDFKVYFIGIGGKGLNGIAKYCLKRGIGVCGSDIRKSEETESIKKLGGEVFYDNQGDNLNSSIDLVVRTSVIENNPEITKAHKLNIPVIKRSEFLGAIISQFQNISVVGSHGKSTTTALVGLALQFSGQDPTIFGGAYIKEIGSYERVGNGKYCVTESCEYDRSFLDLPGNISIITSLEKSHLEYYKDEEEMLQAFRDFVGLHKAGSTLIANGDNIEIRKLIFHTEAKLITYGFNMINDYVIKDVTYENNKSIFSVFKGDNLVIKDLQIKLPGSYNILNFVSVVVLFDKLGLDLSFIRELGLIFTGVGRRFEIHPINEILTFIDDFSHHPTQVKNLFDGIKQFFPDYKIYAVFQPRQYHLIKTFIKEYGGAFKKADKILVTDIIPALGDSDSDKKSLKVDQIIKSIKRHSYKNDVIYSDSFDSIIANLKNEIKDKTIVATIGAGDINKLKDLYTQYV